MSEREAINAIAPNPAAAKAAERDFENRRS
jgi:hypothetical protein